MKLSLISETGPLRVHSATGPIPTPKLKRTVGGWVVAIGFAGLLSIGSAQTNYQQLISFGSASTSGQNPSSILLEDGQGVLYGMAGAGGTHYAGTLFRLNPDGSDYTVLRSFTNGPFPYGGLLVGADGALYGTRSGGGSNHLGLIFRCDTNGAHYAILHSFAGPTNGPDGAVPDAGLIQGADGALYGTTENGGAADLGTVFKLQTDGQGYQILHSFTGTTNNGDGSHPFGGVVQGMDGRLYGTTRTGGSNDLGTVFTLDTNGNAYAVLHDFAGGNTDGATPYGRVVPGRQGALYGLTTTGGTSNHGVVFKLNTGGGDYVLLHQFGGSGDGETPWGNLVQGSDGALRGTTRFGGSSGIGTVFMLSTNGGQYRILYSFNSSGGDGNQPLTGLLFGSDGDWYGTTYFGGKLGEGSLFRLLAGAPHIRITRIETSGGNVRLSFADGAAGQTYKIEATTNLSMVNGWKTLGTTNAALDGTFHFMDSEASSYPVRFYRSATP